ncbi:MAG: tetratricopeptide repeat protein [Chitinophagaceae bacterium]|nr:tetratricopeptide repeat protein [Chitinophagaceae bacterium]
MKEQSSQQNNEELRELLKQYQHLRAGRGHSFLDEESFEKIIDHFDDAENLPGALEAAEIAMQHYPYSSALVLKKADLLIATRKYMDALDTLDHAELLDSHDINLYILKTDAYLALDQQEKAVELLENALALFSGEEKIELLFELADVYDDYEEFDKLFDCLSLILDQDPTNEEALHKICFWTDFTGRNEEGIRLHLRIIDDFPYSELAWFNLAAAYQGLKLYEKAIDAYKYAVVIDEKFDYAYRNMGDAYIRLRRYKDAIEVLEKVLELSRPEDVIYEAIGHCYDKLKNFAQARFYYKKASHMSPDDSKIYYKVACTYINEHQWTQAVKQLESAMQISRMQPEYNLAMGECKMKLGNIKDAILNFSNVVRSRPKNVAGWEALVRCLYNSSFYEEALEQANAALSRTDGKTLFTYYLSAIYLAMGKSKEAMLHLEKALIKAPKLLKKFIELNPSILQNQQVVEMIARHKRKK